MKFSKQLLLIILLLIVSPFVLTGAYQFSVTNEWFYSYINNNCPAVVEFAQDALKLTDLLFIGSYFGKDEVSTLYLEVPWEDLLKLDLALPEQVKTDAVLTYEGVEYEVEMKYRGDSYMHYTNPKKSIRIYMGDDDLLDGMSSFHLIIPEDRGYLSEDYSHYVSNKLGLVTLNSDFYKVYINGEYFGLYYMIEQPTEAFLERNGLSLEGNVYKNESEIGNQGDAFNSVYYWEKLVESNVMAEDDFSDLELLLKSIEENLPSEDIIDIDNFLLWDVHFVLLNTHHESDGGNLITYFNPDSGKFIFIPWDTAQQNLPLIDINANHLVSYVLQNPEYMFKRNQILWEYLEDGENLIDDLNYMQEQFDYIKNALYTDTKTEKPNIISNHWIEACLGWIPDHYALIEEALRDSHGTWKITEIGDGIVRLDIVSEGFSAIKFDVDQITSNGGSVYEDTNDNAEFDLEDMEIFESRILYTSRDFASGEFLEVLLIPTEYTFFIVSDVTDWELEFLNAVTGDSANVAR